MATERTVELTMDTMNDVNLKLEFIKAITDLMGAASDSDLLTHTQETAACAVCEMVDAVKAMLSSRRIVGEAQP